MNQLKTKLEHELGKLSGSVSLSVKFLHTNETLEFNSTEQIWAASVIKIPIACELYKQVAQGNIDLTKKIHLSPENSVDGTGVLKLLDPSDEYTVLDLVKLMLAISDNAATNQLIDIIGWENVETYMTELGLKNTTFRHKMMIKAGRGPNLTTSSDITVLLEKLHKNKLPGAQQIIEILKQQQDRTRIPLLLPNDIQVAHKPGSLPEAMHDAGIVYAQKPFIFVFLSDSQKDKRLTNMVLAECAKLCYEFTTSP